MTELKLIKGGDMHLTDQTPEKLYEQLRQDFDALVDQIYNRVGALYDKTKLSEAYFSVDERASLYKFVFTTMSAYAEYKGVNPCLARM